MDFVVLLAALLRKRTQIVNIVTRNILQKHNPNGRFKVGRRCHRCLSGPTPRHGACQHQAQAATAHPRPTPAPEPCGVPASWGIAVGCSSPHSQLILTLLGRPEASASRTSLLGEEGWSLELKDTQHSPPQFSSQILAEVCDTWPYITPTLKAEGQGDFCAPGLGSDTAVRDCREPSMLGTAQARSCIHTEQ